MNPQCCLEQPEVCKCTMKSQTQLWSIKKQVWKSERKPPELPIGFAPLHDHVCSVSIDRHTSIFFGGHYLLSKANDEDQYRKVVIKFPLNDKVFEYSFKTLEWTEFASIPNIQVKFTSLCSKFVIQSKHFSRIRTI